MMSNAEASSAEERLDPHNYELRRGDLVRASEWGQNRKAKIKSDRGVGRVITVYQSDSGATLFDVEWLLGGRSKGVSRRELVHTTATSEGMTQDSKKRQRRPAARLEQEIAPPELKKTAKAANKGRSTVGKTKSVKGKKQAPIAAKKTSVKKSRATKKKSSSTAAATGTAAAKKSKKKPSPSSTPQTVNPMKLYEKHERELTRRVLTLEKQRDPAGRFWDDAPDEYVEAYEGVARPTLPARAPYNWEMFHRRMDAGFYTKDRYQEVLERDREIFNPYYQDMAARKKLQKSMYEIRVSCPKRLDWERIHADILGMIRWRKELAIEDREEDPSQKDSVVVAANKLEEALGQMYPSLAKKHAEELLLQDDIKLFAAAVDPSKNDQAAMQSWRKLPYPERKYERLSTDVVCAGLSELDEKIATYELKTNLSDSFVGISYRYDDTGQSEAWMKSVVDETGQSSGSLSKAERKAAKAMAADNGVIKAQVNTCMESLLIAVQDRVMTDHDVVNSSELRSANWERSDEASTASKDLPQVTEQPVWGIDCYTRQNISMCLEAKFEADVSQAFIDKWLLPVINSCPEDLAHDILHSARILEGLPLIRTETKTNDNGSTEECRIEVPWTSSHLGAAMQRKMSNSAPTWLKGAANLLRRARTVLGLDFFRVHPKGHGSVLLTERVPANILVTFYRGELYPSWRWGEKLDAIEVTQKRKNLKPNLPDFYNMALERPQIDPRGYGLLFVDASRKAGHGSSVSHSCNPTCEVRVAAKDGELCLAMTTIRELEMGEELTFNYNAVTESLNEYRSAICLCGSKKCRGSFLHFAAADCYQQVLNRNAPIAARFSNLVKGSMKQVMSDEDKRTLESHGFLTAAFGAISVNRRDTSADGGALKLLDSTDCVPIWLRTYVAEVLRYIEYERRALPIALICDHLTSMKHKAEQAGQEKPRGKGGPKTSKAKRTSTDQMIRAAKISFQDADAEGVSAMEQRIQQLTQTLSRVGRVLDRHRERQLESSRKSESNTSVDFLRGIVHAPVELVSNEDAIRFLWSDPRGPVVSLMTQIKKTRCKSKSLVETLTEIHDEFGSLAGGVPPTRRNLNEAMLKMRHAIITHLDNMAKTHRLYDSLVVKVEKSSSMEQSNAARAVVGHVVQDMKEIVLKRATGLDRKSHVGFSASQRNHMTAAEYAIRLRQRHPWLESFGERGALLVAADMLAYYAHTKNFFVMKPYEVLTSTPVEVYARELGNSVPKSVVDAEILRSPRSSPPGVKPSDAGDLCEPEDTVAEVELKYEGEYVFSQLLQWYNGGVGGKSGLPDITGCISIPPLSSCWTSTVHEQSFKRKATRKTAYEERYRRRIVAWLQDPLQRGGPWPEEVQSLFGKPSSKGLHDQPMLGSPIIDFLATGDESSICSVLDLLDVDAPLAGSDTGDATMLASVDKGRPAQAVCSWVQCEDPACMKWRKVPWNVDLDTLPKKFFCQNNTWNPEHAHCGAPEDEWDGDDKLVGADGKVEGSPIRKRKNEVLSPTVIENYAIGARFDVLRDSENGPKYYQATVVNIDISGLIKRAKLSFQCAGPMAKDEWIEIGSPRIKALFSKTSGPKKSKEESKRKNPGASTTECSASNVSPNGVEAAPETPSSKLASNVSPAIRDSQRRSMFAADPSLSASASVPYPPAGGLLPIAPYPSGLSADAFPPTTLSGIDQLNATQISAMLAVYLQQGSVGVARPPAQLQPSSSVEMDDDQLA